MLKRGNQHRENVDKKLEIYKMLEDYVVPVMGCAWFGLQGPWRLATIHTGCVCQP